MSIQADQKQDFNIPTSFNIQQNISLADKNWFKTGGSARFYCEPTTPQQFASALSFAHENNLEVFAKAFIIKPKVIKNIGPTAPMPTVNNVITFFVPLLKSIGVLEF